MSERRPITHLRAKIGTALVVAAIFGVIVYLAWPASQEEDARVTKAKELVRRGSCNRGDGLAGKPPAAEYYEGVELFLRAKGERAPVPPELGGEQAACIGSLVIVCNEAAREPATRDRVCEPWREFARWMKHEVKVDIVQVCTGCAYLVE